MNNKQISLSEQINISRRNWNYREALIAAKTVYAKDHNNAEKAHDFLDLLALNFRWAKFNFELELFLEEENSLITKAIETVKEDDQLYYGSLRAKYSGVFMKRLSSMENNLALLQKRISFIEISSKLFNNDSKFVTIHTYLLLDAISILAEHDKNAHKHDYQELLFFKQHIAPLLKTILSSKTKPEFENIMVRAIGSENINIQERIIGLKKAYPEIAWVNKILMTLENSNREIKPVKKDLPQVSAEEAAG